MDFRHRCHADFQGSAAALPWKAQGLGRISSQNLALEQSGRPCKPRLAALPCTHYNKNIQVMPLRAAEWGSSMKIATAQQMREMDRAASQDRGIPSTRLMEHAARAGEAKVG